MRSEAAAGYRRSSRNDRLLARDESAVRTMANNFVGTATPVRHGLSRSASAAVNAP
jgi:hypothetical protein